MALFNRKPAPGSSYRPTDAEVQNAADKLNSGRQRPADRLVEKSGERGQETSMRILAATALPAPEDPHS